MTSTTVASRAWQLLLSPSTILFFFILLALRTPPPRARHDALLTRLCHRRILCVFLPYRSLARSRTDATALRAFGAALLRHAPLPDVVLFLNASPAACLAREGAGMALALDDLERLAKGTRQVVDDLGAKGCEVYTRRWDSFGRTAAMRDTVLCAEPKPPRKGRAPPSSAAVEGILQDAWASALSIASPPVPVPPPVPEARDENDRAAANGAATPSAAQPPQSPINVSGTCASREGSPASICERLEFMPTFGEQIVSAA